MVAAMGVGIYGVGFFLPPLIRRNDWWPEAVVEGWRRRPRPTRPDMGRAPLGLEGQLSEGARRTLEAIAAMGDDIFQGSAERHIMPEGMSSSQMEGAAAREAISASGVDPSDIDLLVTYSYCPDRLAETQACRVHHELGLTERCVSMSIEGGANSFLQQMALAHSFVAAGRAKLALLVQSTATSRLLRWEEPSSLFFGDAATAVVVGPVSPGKGILGQTHHTDGSLSPTVTCGVPGRSWYDEGRCVIHLGDPAQVERMFLSLADFARQAIEEALAAASLSKSVVDFFACHQGMPWLRAVAQQHAGLSHARSVDTFARTASVQACNIPLVVATGEREGLIRDGDTVAMFSGGSGSTWSGMVVRWGR